MMPGKGWFVVLVVAAVSLVAFAVWMVHSS